MLGSIVDFSLRTYLFQLIQDVCLGDRQILEFKRIVPKIEQHVLLAGLLNPFPVAMSYCLPRLPLKALVVPCFPNESSVRISAFPKQRGQHRYAIGLLFFEICEF